MGSKLSDTMFHFAKHLLLLVNILCLCYHLNHKRLYQKSRLVIALLIHKWNRSTKFYFYFFIPVGLFVCSAELVMMLDVEVTIC